MANRAHFPRSPARPGAWLWGALLCAVTLALYWRTGAYGFLAYDDDVYVTANEGVRGGLSWEGLRWAFATGHAANWHPLTWLSHQLDVQLFGLASGAHHRVNAGLHALNAALLFAALRALTGATGKSALVAALFALHPLRVESVAWVAERKDVLSAGLALGCLWAYAGYARRGGAGRYALALGLFALGLLAKPMLVTIPFLLVLLDFWPLGRIPNAGRPSPPEGRERHPTPSRTPARPGEGPGGWKRYGLLLEKVPFLALALASALVTLLVQRAGGAFGSGEAIGLEARLANALHALGLYAAKTLVPSGLAVFHPHPALVAPVAPPWSLGALTGLGFVLVTSLVLVGLRRRAPYALLGWLWFLGLLVPVLGLVQVGLQSWAERYSYLPTIGLLLALVWGAEALFPRARRVLVGAGLLACALLALASVRQLESWRGTRALFARALAVEERNPVAHVHLGRECEQAGELEGAREHYARALELQPALAGVRVNLARVLVAMQRPEEARAELERALQSEPEMGPAHAALGWLLASAFGRDTEALTHLRRACALAPGDAALANNLAWVLATSASAAAPEEALALAERWHAATGSVVTLETRAAALARLGRFAEAVQCQEQALARVPAAHRARLGERLELYRAGRPFLKSP